MYKNTNWIKRGAVAAVAAGLMLGALPGVAMAATVADTDAANLVKTWNVADDGLFSHDQAFEFTMEYKDAKAAGDGAIAPSAPTGVNANWSKTLVLGGAENTPGRQGALEGGNKSYTGQFDLSKFFEGLDFTTPGQYYFQLFEKKGNNPNIDWSTKTYTVRVIVRWNVDEETGNYIDSEGNVLANPIAKISGVQVINGSYNANLDKDLESGTGDGTKATDANFVNDAAANSFLEISKTVAGSAADPDADFTFSVKLGSLNGNYSFDKSDGVVVAGAGGKSVSTVTNGTYTITMGHGEHLKIKNLPVGATYEVEETNRLGYDTDITTTDAKNDVKTSGSIDSVGVEVAFRNEKGFAPQTGITMNTLPFVGVAAVAAAGAVTLVISRKRRAGEEF